MTSAIKSKAETDLAEAEERRATPDQADLEVLAYLHAQGLRVEPKDLPRMLQAALEGMHRTLFPLDPAADLSEEETAVLRQGGFEMKPSSPDPSNMLARTAAEYAALLETSLAAGEVAQRLGVDPSRVRQLLTARKIYGIQIKGNWKIPAFQFEGGRLIPGLDEVMPALPKGLHPVGVYRWFTMPNPDLVPEGMEQELSPRDWLLAGYPPKVVADLAVDLDNL